MNPKHYIGKPCKHGHAGLRYKKNSSCVACASSQDIHGRKERFKRDYAKPETWAKRLLWRTRERAEKLGIPFNLTVEDCVVPKVCPVLGLPLKVGGGRNCPTSPSLDKIIPSKGYVKGNVRVISWRANEIKGNATADELAKVLRYVRKS